MTISAFPYQPRTSQLPREISQGVLALRALLEREGWRNLCPPVKLDHQKGGLEEVMPLWLFYLKLERKPEAFLRELEYWPAEEPTPFERFSLCAPVRTFFFRVVMLEMVRLCALLPSWFVKEHRRVSCRKLNTLLLLKDFWRVEFFPTEEESEAASHEQLVVDAAFLLLVACLLERARSGVGYLPEEMQERLERVVRDTYRRLLKQFKVVPHPGEDIANVVWAQLGMWVEQAQSYYAIRARDATLSAEWYTRLGEIAGRSIIAIAQVKERSQPLQAQRS